MASLNLSNAEARTFRCPNCNEVVNTAMVQCTFCASPIDHNLAEIAADIQEKVNQAYSKASYLTILASTMLVFLALTFVPIPFLWLISVPGFLFLVFAIPISAISWRAKFGSIRTDDPDFEKAKRLTHAALFIWFVMLPAFVGRWFVPFEWIITGTALLLGFLIVASQLSFFLRLGSSIGKRIVGFFSRE